MQKKIDKKQEEIKQAQLLRATRKIYYDAQNTIVKGHRETVKELESRADLMLKDYIAADEVVNKKMQELNTLISEMENINLENK